MTSLLQQTYTDDQLYPSFDGNPMAENTLQYEWIVLIKENLECLFDHREDVFIAGDLLWYPIRVSAPPAPRQAPDVMVVFGRPKGHRKSYRQPEEENIAPQVAFEILSDSNKTREGRESMALKFAFYERYGVEEYYIYDPDSYLLQGWLREGEKLLPIGNLQNWISPRLGIRFRSIPGEKLGLFFPDNSPFLNTIELSKSLRQAQEKAEQAQQRAEIERLSNQKLREKLRSLGIDPDKDI